MNQKVLNTLEYDKVIERLKAYATTELGKAACEKLEPMTDEPEISLAQEQTQDALTRLYKQGSISFFGVHDLGASLKRLKMKGTLSAGELLEIAGLLEAVKNALAYGAQRDDMADADSLDSVFESLVPMDGLLKDIRHCIISPEEISDDASSALKDIRRNMKLTNQKIHSQLTAMVSSSSNKDMLQDALVTMRNGRYCIPVKQEYRGQFKIGRAHV